MIVDLSNCCTMFVAQGDNHFYHRRDMRLLNEAYIVNNVIIVTEFVIKGLYVFCTFVVTSLGCGNQCHRLCGCKGEDLCCSSFIKHL